MDEHKVINAEVLDLKDIQIVNDNVMGGQSKSQVEHVRGGIRFYGQVSLANNGGFASFRIPLQPQKINAFSAFLIKLQGDGHSYQFRVQENQEQKHAYVVNFDTTGEPQEIKIPFDQLQPQFRGNRLDIPNFNGENLSRLGLMILPGQAVDFELILKEISLV